MTGFLVESLGWVLRDYGVDGRLLLPLKSLYSCSEVYVRVDGVKSQPFTAGCWTSTSACDVTTPLHSLYELDTVTAESTRAPQMGSAGSTVCFLWAI